MTLDTGSSTEREPDASSRPMVVVNGKLTPDQRDPNRRRHLAQFERRVTPPVIVESDSPDAAALATNASPARVDHHPVSSAGGADYAPEPVNLRGLLLPFGHYLVDSLMWAIAIVFTLWMRYDFDTSPIMTWGVVLIVTAAVAMQGVFGITSGLYSRRWRYGSFDEVKALATAIFLTGATLMFSVLSWRPVGIHRSVAPIAMAITLNGAVAVRSAWRLLKEKRTRPTTGSPIVVIGAGEDSYRIVAALLANPESPYRPAALLDDDPLKANLRWQGVRVEGTIGALEDVVVDHGARTVLLAIPNASGALVQKLSTECYRLDLDLLVLPTVDGLFGSPTLADIRPVSEVDLLGRRQVEIDDTVVTNYITGRRVLVTGAGGSIGSELCRQLAMFQPAELIMLDRDESGLHAVQLSIEGRALLSSPGLVLADIRDIGRMHEIFQEYRPHVVFHAAALKHLPLLETAPEEAWKTNVLGTRNVLAAAQASGVERFVNISTDKAADPASVLGYSKRITERMTASVPSSAAGTYVSVRFGNVLGSRGSVLTAFRAQAETGGPITVTHPDVTRFFMTIAEAVRLTVYAGAIGTAGEVMVLDMGEPVRIFDVAARFARLQTPPLGIVFTGLRPGEKMHEDLMGEAELGERRVHPLVTHVQVPPLPTASTALFDDAALKAGRDLLADMALSETRQQA